MTTIAKFIAAYGVTMTYAKAESNPAMADSDNMDHWRCALRVSDRTMRLMFSKGFGHNGEPPTLAEVLECVALDCGGFCHNFEGWCREYGYDADSRRAERIHRAIARQVVQLRLLLGPSAYDNLILLEFS